MSGDAKREAAASAGFTVLLLLAMVAWGGTWISGKLIAGLAPPPSIIFWRFLFTTASVAGLAFLRGDSLRVPARSLPHLLGSGALIVVFNLCFLLGVRVGLAGAGGVLVTTLNPVMTFGWGLLLLRRRAGLLAGMGLALGLAGGAVILRVWSINGGELLRSGNLFFLMAPALWSLLTVHSQVVQRRLSYMAYSVYTYLLATLISLGFAIPAGLMPASSPILFWGNILFLAIPATAFSTTVYFLASARLGSGRASSFIFLVPVSALLGSWLVLGEVPQITTLVGGGLSVAAVYLVNRRSRPGEQAPVSGEEAREAGAPP